MDRLWGPVRLGLSISLLGDNLVLKVRWLRIIMVVIEIVIFVIIIHVREVHRASNDTVFSYYRIITVLLSLFQLLKKRLLFGGQLLAIEQIRKVPATASTVPHVLVCPLYSRGSLHQLFDSFLDLIFNIIIYFGSRWCPL